MSDDSEVFGLVQRMCSILESGSEERKAAEETQSRAAGSLTQLEAALRAVDKTPLITVARPFMLCWFE